MNPACIQAVIKAAKKAGKKYTEDDVAAIEQRIRAARRKFIKRDPKLFVKMTEEERIMRSAEMVAEDIAFDAELKKKQVVLQVQSDAQYQSFKARMQSKGLSPAKALEQFAFFDASGRGVTSVESMAKGTAAIWKSKLEKLFKAERGGVFNLFDDPQFKQSFWREMYGENSGHSVAKDAAKQVNALFDEILDTLKRLGVPTSELDNYRSPQRMSPWLLFRVINGSAFEAMARGGRGSNARLDAVAREIMDALDRDMYLDNKGLPMSDADLLNFVKQSIKTIVTDGATKTKEGKVEGLTSKYKSERQLHFKDAESFMRIMGKYSETSPIDMIFGHVESIAMDAALYQKFGPDGYKAFLRRLADAAKESPVSDANLLASVRNHFDNMLGLNSGITNHYVHNAFSKLRQAMALNLLGSNTITQLSDQGTSAMTAHAMNIPVIDAVAQQAKVIADAGYRDTVRSVGFGLETMSNMVARMADNTNLEGILGKLNSAQLRLNLSSQFTNAVRMGFGASFSAKLASMATKYAKLADLSPKDRAILESKGVTDSDWAIWKQVNTDYGPDAPPLLSAQRLLELPDSAFISKAEAANMTKEEISEIGASRKFESASKLMGMMVEETYMASLQPSELASLAGGKRGAFFSELGTTFLQFKAYPFAMLKMHIMQRGMNSTYLNKSAYLAGLFTTTSIMGGVALLLNDIASGRDPREIYSSDDPAKAAKFGFQAMMKGGGIGIFESLLNVDFAYDYDPMGAVSGPGIGEIRHALAATSAGIRAASQAVSGEDASKSLTKLGREASLTATGLIPFKNLMWTKGAVNSFLLADMNEFITPGYKERMRRSAVKNYNSGYFMQEQRAPDLSIINRK